MNAMVFCICLCYFLAYSEYSVQEQTAPLITLYFSYLLQNCGPLEALWLQESNKEPTAIL